MTGYMTTYTGRRFSHVNPMPDQISIIDIAHHLSLTCHWNGACREFFSVAQHSVIVSILAPAGLKKWGLLHDAAEAYCGDMTRPLKVLLPEYKAIEMRCLQVIASVFGLAWPEPSTLKPFDNQALALEARALMPNGGFGTLHDGFGQLLNIVVPPMKITPLPAQQAEQLFLRHFSILYDTFPGAS